MASAVSLAHELQRRVICFNCGDELYAGEWLLEFRRAEGAWMVCVEAIQAGRPTCCDEELLQEFCAQTLAHLARSFRSRVPESSWKAARDGLEAMLAMHAESPKGIWKQLALALTCADLWLGSCVVASVLQAATLPVDIRNELLILPTELLFSDRALPLDDVGLRRTAAMALFTTCQSVFPFLLQRIDGESMQVLASWLRAVRKSLRLLVGCDELAPLRKLAEHGEELTSAVQLWPAAACEVAQELALWPACDNELAFVLGPVLRDLFTAVFEEPVREVMLPLLQDLASNCWPKAAMGDLDLDWQSISMQALHVIHATLDDTEADTSDVEAVFGVWQTFAATLCKGQADVEQSKPGMDGVFEPRHKRSRRRDQWCASRDRLARCQHLPQLFGYFVEQLLERLRAPEFASQDELVTIYEMRTAAQPAIAAWAALLGQAHAQAQAAQLQMEAQAWFEAAWSPLQRLCQGLPTCSMEAEDVCVGAEVVLWFSASLAVNWPDQAEAVPVKQVLPALGAIDTAPYPWRPLMWSSACSFAAKAPAEHSLELLEWMLERSPVSVGSMPDHPVNDIQELTELAYAQALEVVSRQLPSGVVHVAVGDRLATLAMETFPYGTGHKDSAKAQLSLLLGLRHAMGSEPSLLCQGLNEKALPLLADAVDGEERDSATDNDPPWNAAQALFSTLVCSLPEGLSTDMQHPSGALWKQQWKYLEGALLYWQQSSTTEQPATAAVEALIAAVRSLPMLLPDVLQLLAQSAQMNLLPDVQLAGLRDIAVAVPCPPVDSSKAADLLATAILGVSSDLLMKWQEIVQSPSTLHNFFRLLAEAMSNSSSPSKEVEKDNESKECSHGLCEGKLCSTLLAAPDFIERCLESASELLAERCAENIIVEIFRFAAGILASSGESRNASQRGRVIAALPTLCTAVCRALALQECLLDLEVLGGAAQVLTLAAVGYGSDFEMAIAQALDILQAPMFNRERLQSHVAACAAWGTQKMEWLEQLQQIVREWQNERRHANV